eukprot:jgi/Phyca11/119482/e_gw1.38.392.1
MQKAGQLPAVLQIVKEFGHLSGLHFQPAKSVFISLNTAVARTELFYGIPVLQHGGTTRYLGYQVGTKDTRDVNWADRIRKIQRRLATACRLSTTVEDRVDILNSIVLPAITFTAAAFPLPKWAEKQLISIQKKLLVAIPDGNKRRKAQDKSKTGVPAQKSRRDRLSVDSVSAEGTTSQTDGSLANTEG